jgi:CBS domain-containing membrane protein
MTHNLTLELNFDEGDLEKDRASLARIYVSVASSYLKDDGSTVISADCESLERLGAEAERLKEEIDSIVARAGERFAGRAEPEVDEPASGAAPAGTKRRLELGEDLFVRDCMTSPVCTVDPCRMLSEANEIFHNGNFRHLVVLDDDSQEVVGVLSQRSIIYTSLDWVMGHGKNEYSKTLENVSVKDVMDSRVTTISPDAHLSEAAGLMSEKKIGCLPVVEKERLVGILTDSDFRQILTTAKYRGGDSG